MTAIDAARETVRERIEPVLDSLSENVRGARRVMTRGRHAAEDFAASRALQVRRHPLASVGIAAAAGAVVGCLLGFALRGSMRTR